MERITDVPAATAAAAKETAAKSAVWAVTRVVTVFFTALEVLLLFRFLLKVFGANANQPLVAGLYQITDPLVRPFQGFFPTPADAPALDLAAVLAVVFFALITALIVALVRAITLSREPVVP